MIKTARHSTLSPQMWCIKKKIKDWFARTQIYWQEDYFLGVHIQNRKELKSGTETSKTAKLHPYLPKFL